MPIIKNFGFMWERDEVNWGSQGPGGAASLEGRQVAALKRVVNFNQQMGIYVLYDRFEQPVQIGQSKNLFERLKQHRKDHLRNRWRYFSWFGFYKVGKKNVLLFKGQAANLRRTVTLSQGLDEIEAVLIQVLEPRLNRRGANWGKETEEYLQVPRLHVEDDIGKGI